MVVQYMTGFGVRVPIRGVYVAASADDTNLRATEDPAHSEWQSAQSTGAPSDARKVAARVKAEIRKQVEEWVMKFIPPAPTSTVKLDFMSQLFGRLIPTTGRGEPRPSDPVSILTIRREPIASGNGIRGVLEFSVELTQKHDKNEAEVVVEVVAIIKEGEGASGDPISSTLEHLSGGTGLEVRGNELILTLVKGEAGVFRATTEEFPDVWAVDLRPMVVLSGKGKGKGTRKKKAK
jgi:hypothetical protein